MLVPAFQLNLNTPILEGLVTVGKFDGQHASLACGTAAGKVFVHCPHDRTLDSLNGLRLLNINRRLTALTAGKLDPEKERDILVVGSQNNILAFDVESNSDVFFKDVPDGVSALVVGKLGTNETPLVVAGGNCTIQGYDAGGQEAYWSVTGDTVTAMTLADVNSNGKTELVVGSADYELRVFKDEEIAHEAAETDKPVALVALAAPNYGYALANGTVGMYKNSDRVWRVRTRGQVTSLAAFDIDADGQDELVSGWGSGRVEARRTLDGESVFKDHLGAPISGMVVADYRGDKSLELVCAALDGEVRGYTARAPPTASALSEAQRAQEDEELRKLSQQKQQMMTELKQYEDSLAKVKSAPTTATTGTAADTKVTVRWRTSIPQKRAELVVAISGSLLLKAASVFAEDGGIFPSGESYFLTSSQLVSELVVPFAPQKDVGGKLKIKAIAGLRGSQVMQVYELETVLPRFALYSMSASTLHPSGKAVVRINDRAQRAELWLKSSFIMTEGVTAMQTRDSLDVSFVSMRSGQPLRIRFDNEGGGTLTVMTNDMDLAGEIIQELAAFMQIKEATADADFPDEFSVFADVLKRVDEHNAVRQKMTAEMADTSSAVKMLAVRAEDSRMLQDMPGMRKVYTTLYELNGTLITEYTKRATNHQSLLAALRDVNAMIQKASKLRVGATKAAVVSACREAIRGNNIGQLMSIIRYGRA